MAEAGLTRPARGAGKRLHVGAAVAVSLLLIGCGAVSERVAPSVPTGLDPSHVLLAIDYIVHHPALAGVYDPRSVTPRWATGSP